MKIRYRYFLMVTQRYDSDDDDDEWNEAWH